jgi:SAM-dependent methyltransferase
VRHAISTLRYGRNPAATVYESLGTDFVLALAPGWLNLGLWEGDGSDPTEALEAPRNLVSRLASDLPSGGEILDVGNGLGVQDPVIAEVAGARRLTAVNITHAQLRAGRPHLAEAGAHGVTADACRLPFRPASFDGLISVEAAFHFPSRRRFFREAARVLRPGGVLTMSDIATMRRPRGPREALAGLSQIRAWGLGLGASVAPEELVRDVERARMVDVHYELVGDRTIGPALRFVRDRLEGEGRTLPWTFRSALRVMLSQVDLLWRRGLLEYVLLRAEKGS